MMGKGSRILLIIFVAISSIILARTLTFAEEEKQAELIEWLDSFAKAQEIAAYYHRPIFLHLCPPGKMARNEDATAFFNEDVKTLMRYFVPVRIDPENNSEIVKKFDPKNFPVIVIITPDLERLGANIEGHADFPDLIKLMTAILKKYRIVTPEMATEMEGMIESAEKFIEQGSFARAIRQLISVKEKKPESGITKKAQTMLDELSQKAKERLSEADKLAGEGDKEGALDIYREVRQNYRGLPEADESEEKEKQLKDKVGETTKEVEENASLLFTRAKLCEDNDLLEQALELYKELVAKYPGSDFAKSAEDRIAAIEKELRR